MLAVLAGLALLAAPAVIQSASRRPFGGVLRVPAIETLQTTDPARVTSQIEWLAARQLHESLFRLAADGSLEPALAQALPKLSEDGLELLVQLRPGLVFHDGSDVTAKDVIASWHRLLAPETASPHWWLLAPIKGAIKYRQGKLTRISGLEVVNRLTLRIRLRLPMPDFPHVLASVPTAILPRATTRNSQVHSMHPSGAGAFSLPKEQADGTFRLEPALMHWRGRPYLDAIEIQRFDEPKDADLAFELGRVDLAMGKPRRASDFKESTGSVDSQVYLAVNPQLLAGYPEGFRSALLQAIDRQALVNYVHGERGHAVDELLVGAQASRAPLSTPPDPGKARAYFKEHYLGKAAEALIRHGELPKLKFIVLRDRPQDRATAERVQIDLMDAGVSVIVLPLPLAEYRQQVDAGQFDFRLACPLPLSASTEMQLIGLVAQIQGDLATEELLSALASLPQDGSRAGIIRERARGYQVRVAWLPLFVHGRRFYIRDLVRGLRPGVDGRVDLAEVWRARPSAPRLPER